MRLWGYSRVICVSLVGFQLPHMQIMPAVLGNRSIHSYVVALWWLLATKALRTGTRARPAWAARNRSGL